MKDHRIWAMRKMVRIIAVAMSANMLNQMKVRRDQSLLPVGLLINPQQLILVQGLKHRNWPFNLCGGR
jgi:hypothetical protein